MRTKIVNGKVITEDGIKNNAAVYIENGKIVGIKNDCPDKDWEIIDAKGQYVSPGFIDIHVHGGKGHDFSIDTPIGIAEGINYHMNFGTTTIVPTSSAIPYPKMVKFLTNLRECMEKNMTDVNIPGAHLEGPYFNLIQCGGQSADDITPPVKDEYTDLVNRFKDIIVRWSYAPEKDENEEFIKFIIKNGIIGSIGHSNAIYDDCMRAYNEGVRLITHLYSCMSTVTRNMGYRRLGIIETAYLYDDFDVEIIADGKHLPPELIKLILKIKGENRVTLITDCLEASGADIKTSSGYGQGYIVEDGVCKLPDRQAFAGSIATTDRLVRTLVKDVKTDIVSAVRMITENPARILNLAHKKGKIKAGYDADIVIFDDDINVSRVIINGKITK